MTTLEGEEMSLADFIGKKVMVVNVASKCGLTPQYEHLQKLYDDYKDKGFVIIGFPANDFMKQEPGTDAEIKEFCTRNYGVTFPMFSKITVKGEDKHPLYTWLTEKNKNGKQDAEVSWNFQKFLIDEKGNWVDVLKPKVLPNDEKVIQWLDN